MNISSNSYQQKSYKKMEKYHYLLPPCPIRYVNHVRLPSPVNKQYVSKKFLVKKINTETLKMEDTQKTNILNQVPDEHPATLSVGTLEKINLVLGKL
jgi:hypothetical protein